MRPAQGPCFQHSIMHGRMSALAATLASSDRLLLSKAKFRYQGSYSWLIKGHWKPYQHFFASATSTASVEPPSLLGSNGPIGDHWKAVQQWVVFSDLHVSSKSAKACLAVLEKVRTEAEARNAGIIFLGDFWHARGTLPVVPLNIVLSELQHWRQPTLMLVGNHDQVSLGGLEHGLTPLAASCPSIHVIDTPLLFLDALWLPYRRDKKDLLDTIQAAGPVKAIFAHTDVLGAFVNESFQAREGIEAAAFKGQLTYLGHYHKPQILPDTHVQYIGSPYQVSRSESQQEKALLILNHEWQQIGAVFLDIGPRHFNVTEQQELTNLDLRRGDRVRWSLKEGLDLKAAEPATESLIAQGVEVELITAPPNNAPRIEEVESLGALPLFHMYADTAAMSAEARQRGLNILQEIGPSQGQEAFGKAANIDFDRLEIEGYGPFRESAVYSLGTRGLRVVSGRNADDSGADSNGTGKSSLVMAALWCLTGRSDARTMTATARGLTGGEIVNDDSKKARVEVTGTVSGKAFRVERVVGRNGLISLKFFYDGEDLTGADSRLTQETMEGHLCCNLLTRVVFHTQTDIAGLLEANDKEFKAELSRIAEMTIWDTAKEEASEQLKHANKCQVQLEQQLLVRSEYIADLRNKIVEAQKLVQGWDEENQQRTFEAEDELQQSAVDLSLQLAAASSGLQILTEHIETQEWSVSSAVEVAESTESSSAAEAADSWDNKYDSSHLVDLEQKLQALRREQNTQQRIEAAAAALYQSSKVQLSEYVNLPAESSDEGKTSMVCDRCLQEIDAATFSNNVARLDQLAEEAHAAQNLEHEFTMNLEDQVAELVKHVEEEKAKQASAEVLRLEQVWQKQAAADARKFEAASKQAEAKRMRQAIEDQRANAQSLVDSTERLKGHFEPLLAVLDLAILPSKPSSMIGNLDSLADVLRHQQLLLEVAESSGRQFTQARQSLKLIQSAVNPYTREAEMLEGMTESEDQAYATIKTETSEWTKEIALVKELDTAFGRGGIQSFALEGVLGELQTRTASFLEQLSSEITLSLSASRPKANVAKSKDAAAVEKITKSIQFRSASGKVVQRSVRQLSGGERRRVALALALGFAELASARTGLRCNLLVLDEVLQQLDEEGCSRVSRLLRSMPQANILVVGQADSYVMKVFDEVDTVVKEKGGARLEVM